jgi:outer membrane murein-binding lipoprotein Lpp
MNKTIFAALLAVLVLGGGAYILATTPAEFEVVIADEVSELETQLASLDAQVTAGRLSPEAATVARADILAKLAGIEANASAAGRATLTTAQKQQINEGLDRLKRVLIRYQDTLTVVDNTARKARGTVINRTDRSLQAVFLDTISETEAAAEEASVTVESDASVDAELDVIEEEAPETMEEEIEEVESEESADQPVDDAESATTTEPDTESSEEETTDDEAVVDVDATTTVEADTEIN